ncbi:MAG: pyrroline-5-carboxylate reductase [Candidatus Omnitrophica bacterium]|nr:pyrroline-5-carboxylate reductase [Candidatus Omnitrophota bacterium]
MLGIIGAGKMGSAIITGLLKSKAITAGEILLYDRDPRQYASLTSVYPLKTARNIPELVSLSDICLLAVKPQDKENVLKEMSGIGKRKLVVSILAGIPTGYLEQKLGKIPVVRVMPNIGIKVGAGMSFYSPGRFTRPADLKKVARLFANLGEVSVIAEEKMDLVTALSGSGPAYFFLLMEILAEYAQKSGISKNDSAKMARQSALASALLTKSEPAGQLRAAVTSKSGTTEAAILVLEKAGIRKMFGSALKAARNRARELSL